MGSTTIMEFVEYLRKEKSKISSTHTNSEDGEKALERAKDINIASKLIREYFLTIKK